MQLSNLVFIVMLILLIIILIILYFFSSDIRKNKNNLNIAESNLLSLREKISSMNDKFELLEKKIKSNQMNPDNFSEMLNQLNSINQEIMPNNMMFPMGNDEDDEEDDEDYEDDDDDDEDEDEDDEDDDDDDDDDDEDEDEDDSDNEESTKDSDDEDSEDESTKENDNVKSTKKNDKNKKEVSSMNDIEEDIVVEIKSEPEIKKIIQIEEKPTNLNKDSDTKSQAIGIDDIMDSNEAIDEKPKAGLKKQPKKSIQDCSVGSVEVGEDGETQFKVALNKAGRKFWKKV